MENTGFERCLPQDIERRSFEIIEQELRGRGLLIDGETAFITKRVIHASADFDFARNMRYSEGCVPRALRCLRSGGAVIVTDTQMALSGVSKAAARRLGASLHCFIADEDVAGLAEERGCTRAAAAMIKAARFFAPAGQSLIVAVGNAPTALLELARLHDEGLISPDLLVAVPVGFVNVVAAKELIVRSGIPHIAALGRKGGSTVAAAILNALLYRAICPE